MPSFEAWASSENDPDAMAALEALLPRLRSGRRAKLRLLDIACTANHRLADVLLACSAAQMCVDATAANGTIILRFADNGETATWAPDSLDDQSPETIDFLFSLLHD